MATVLLPPLEKPRLRRGPDRPPAPGSTKASTSMPKLEGSRNRLGHVASIVEHHHYHIHHPQGLLAGTNVSSSSSTVAATGSPVSVAQKTTSLPLLRPVLQDGSPLRMSPSSPSWRVGAPPGVRKRMVRERAAAAGPSLQQQKDTSSNKGTPADMHPASIMRIPIAPQPRRSSLALNAGRQDQCSESGSASPSPRQRLAAPPLASPVSNSGSQQRTPSPRAQDQLSEADNAPRARLSRVSMDTYGAEVPDSPDSAKTSQTSRMIAVPRRLEALNTMQLWNKYTLAKSHSEAELQRLPRWTPKLQRRRAGVEGEEAERQRRRKECQRHLAEIEDGGSKRRFLDGMLSPSSQRRSPRSERRGAGSGFFESEPSWKERQEIRKGMQSARAISSALQDCSKQRQELVRMQQVLKKVEDGPRRGPAGGHPH